MGNHGIKSSSFAMNNLIYLPLLFGWKAQTPGGQVGPTLLVPDRGLIISTSEGLHVKYSTDQSDLQKR